MAPHHSIFRVIEFLETYLVVGASMALNLTYHNNCDCGSDDEQHLAACVLEYILQNVCQLCDNHCSNLCGDKGVTSSNADGEHMSKCDSENSRTTSISSANKICCCCAVSPASVSTEYQTYVCKSNSVEADRITDSIDDCMHIIQTLLNSLETDSDCAYCDTELSVRNKGVIDLCQDRALCSGHTVNCSYVSDECIDCCQISSHTNSVKSPSVDVGSANEERTDQGSHRTECNFNHHTSFNSERCQTGVDCSRIIAPSSDLSHRKVGPLYHLDDGVDSAIGYSAEFRIDEQSISLFENTIPIGWLNTITHKRTRQSTTLTKSEMRKQDFAYCGPLNLPITSNQSVDLNDNLLETNSSCVRLATPVKVDEICQETLYSGIGIAPGTFTIHGLPLVVVDCSDLVWRKCDIGSIGLAHYFLYLTSRLNEVAMLLDERNSSDPSRESLLSALRIYTHNTKVPVNQTILLSNDGKNTAAKLKDLFQVECHIVNTCDGLFKLVTASNLPACLGGEYLFSQAEWIQNRLTVDSFVNFCKNVRHNFERETLLMTSQSMPSTAKETRACLTKHQQDMRQLLDDKQLSHLHERGQRILEGLLTEDSADRRCCANLVQSSYQKASDTVSHFVQVADEKWLALERHLMIKQFEHSCDCIFIWTERNSAVLKENFSEIEDSFEDVMVQSGEFDDFYLQAMQQYAKSDCLLSNAQQLTSLGYITEESLTRRAELAGEEIARVVCEMERKKQEMEVAGKMYKFVDQAYSWALDGMKFVTNLSLEDCLTTESCNSTLAKFDQYMDEHPAIPAHRFNEMLELASRYGNAKCMRQLEFAQQKCVETAELFTKRRELLLKAKSQIKSGEKKKKSTSFRMRNREKLDQNNRSRQDVQKVDGLLPNSGHTPSPTHPDVRRVSLLSSTDEVMSNEDTLSSFSYDSASLDADDVQSSSGRDSTPTSTSMDSGVMMPSCYREHDPTDALSDAGTARSRKPAKKMLKKSASMSYKSCSESATLCRLHSQTGLTIGSPFRTEEPSAEGKSKVALTIEELLLTEKEYVRSLNYVIENYFPEMGRLDIPQPLRCKGNVIFGNLEKIADFHSHYFLRDLEECQGDPMLVAKTFQKHKESFGLYALYSKNKPQSDLLLQEHGNEFFKTKQMELGDKMDLASYLLKPVQRMGKYALLLHAMAKKATGPQERCLKEAEELVKFQLRHGNDLLTMDSIRDCDVNLKEQGKLLLQEQFVIISGRRKFVRRVFLFEDLILFSKPIPMNGGHDTYQYKCSYKTAEIGLTENIGDSGFKFEIWFRRRKPQASQDTFVLQSAARSIKRAWVDEIRGLLWKQALRSRGKSRPACCFDAHLQDELFADHRMIEMSSMGVGSKPHLDLADSGENTIRNRAVGSAAVTAASEEVADRLAVSRTRASIAVSSFDHVSLNSKRPHSIISTSSSTSSVGSANGVQQAPLLSSLALASWNSKGNAVFSPPAAYCDFKAILEDENEDSESASDGRSSVSPENSPNDDVSTESVARQYVTTV